MRLTGAMSMRQKDFGGRSRASRITVGWVTATAGEVAQPLKPSGHAFDQVDDPLGCGESASVAVDLGGNGFGLSTADVVERLVGRKRAAAMASVIACDTSAG